MTNKIWKAFWQGFCSVFSVYNHIFSTTEPKRRRLRFQKLPDNPFEVDRQKLQGDYDRLTKDAERANPFKERK